MKSRRSLFFPTARGLAPAIDVISEADFEALCVAHPMGFRSEELIELTKKHTGHTVTGSYFATMVRYNCVPRSTRIGTPVGKGSYAIYPHIALIYCIYVVASELHVYQIHGVHEQTDLPIWVECAMANLTMQAALDRVERRMRMADVGPRDPLRQKVKTNFVGLSSNIIRVLTDLEDVKVRERDAGGQPN